MADPEHDEIVVAQRTKLMDEGELHLLTLFDNEGSKEIMTVQATSLTTSETTAIRFSYPDWDRQFRFNAALMNPNKKEQRFHWLAERLVFASDGHGGKKLEVRQDAAEEEVQVPLLDSVTRIPTGRMDVEERAALRREMERLAVRREQRIDEKARDSKKTFLVDVLEKQEEEKKKVADRHVRIQQERGERTERLQQQRAEEWAATRRAMELDRKREAAIADKVHARQSRQLGETKECLERLRQADGEKAALAKESLQDFVQARKAEQAAAQAQLAREVDVQKARSQKFRELEAARKQRESEWLAQLQQRKVDAERRQMLAVERKQHIIREDLLRRQALFRRAKEELESSEQEVGEVAAFEDLGWVTRAKKVRKPKDPAKASAIEVAMREDAENQARWAQVEEQRKRETNSKDHQRTRLEVDRAREAKLALQVKEEELRAQRAERRLEEAQQAARKSEDEARRKELNARLHAARERNIRARAVARMGL